MNTETTSSEPTGAHTSPRPPLVRPTSGRAIAGVAAGLASYLGVSVGLIRFGFLLAVVFGGAGFALYIAGWLLIRDEQESESIAQRIVEGIGTGNSWAGVALVAIAALIILDNVTFLPGSLVWATVLVIAGFLLYRGDIPGRRPADPTAETAASVPADDPLREGGQAPPPPPTPARPTTPSVPPPPPEPPSILGRLTVGLGLMALGLLAVIDNLTTAIDAQPRHYLALATVAIGAGLITGAFMGRARWMILLGVFLVPPLIASPAAEIEWTGDFDRSIVPLAFDQLGPAYETGAGSYLFDLREMDWEGQTESLEVDMGAGEIVVILPSDVGITGSAEVGIGQIESPLGDRQGFGDLRIEFDATGAAGTVDLDLSLGIGSIEIIQDTVTEGSN